MSKRQFGSIRRLPSGRYQARYTGPDTREHKAPRTFAAKIDAEAWLADRRREIDRGLWSTHADAPKIDLRTYADQWLAHRTLKPRTRQHYRQLLDAHILPALGHLPLATITPADVRTWHATTLTGKPTMRAHAYSLLRTIFNTAVAEELADANPCRIHSAGSAKRVHRIRPATVAELETITQAMPERYRAMILLASWCALRFGELTELRRRDIQFGTEEVDGEPPSRWAEIRVRRAVVRVGGEFVVGTPKSDAGIRDVHVPPHLVPMLEDHLADFVAAQPDSLLFPAVGGGHLLATTLYNWYYPARNAAGRTDLRFHDLRHSGAVLAASTGATLAELMARLGHSTPAMAMKYQHAAAGRDRAIARLLSARLGK
ncbi:tyrosine-type recombinase/integrase [Nocardia fusca]|uniref:tyrosine-type recombinase/integrase n=1 Tax=Nocardia fusca TaxID=941183 RepID=UPI0037CA14DB